MAVSKKVIQTPIGQLAIEVEDNQLAHIKFLSKKSAKDHDDHPLLKKIEKQLHQYFENPHFIFQLPVKVNGTIFQKKVWKSLQDIPVGSTLSYGELAKHLHTSPRAIGNACQANPIPLIIPCHRVVSQQGLGGFCGKRTGNPLAIKSWLLNHEKHN